MEASEWSRADASGFAVQSPLEPNPSPTMNTLKSLLTAATLAVFLALGSTGAVAQVSVQDDCSRLQGTIQVADDAPNRAELTRITHEQAAEAALAALPGATVQDTDLEEEDGFLVYEVDMILDRQEYEAYVDAGSGNVLCLERD